MLGLEVGFWKRGIRSCIYRHHFGEHDECLSGRPAAAESSAQCRAGLERTHREPLVRHDSLRESGAAHLWKLAPIRSARAAR